MPNQLPASIRQLKARLRVLKRPMVWGSTAVLILAALFIAEYWRNPDRWLQSDRFQNSRPRGPSLDAYSDREGWEALPPPEDGSLGADIDSLPLLLGEIDGVEEGEETDTPEQNPESSGLGLLSRSPREPGANSESDSLLNAPTQSSSPGDSSSRLFDLSIPQTLGTSRTAPTSEQNSESSTNPFSNLLENLFGSSRQAPSQPVTSPLQTQMEQYSRSGSQQNQPSSTQNSSQDSAQASPGRQSSGGVEQPNLLFPGPGASGQSELPQQLQPFSPGYYAPQTSPPPGTTGYTLPPSLRLPSPGTAYDNLANPQAAPQSLSLPQAPQIAPTQPGNLGGAYSGQTPTYGFPPDRPSLPSTAVPQPQFTQPSPAPFTTPRSAPGSSIGGGRINTFSNP